MRSKYFDLRLLPISILLFSSLCTLLAQQHTELNCFTIVVGKEVSADGNLLVAHNEDDWGRQIVNLYKTPSQSHSEEEIIRFANSGSFNQAKNTNGFIWIELPGMKVADSFINDQGVVITSNGCPSREDKPDSTDGGILYWMRRLVAERATSAEDGVKLAGNLIDKFGYVSAGRTYTIADRNEAWILSAVYGRHWIAQRVPDKQVAVIPNYYTIGEINLKDTLNFLGSPDIIEYAVKRGWYNPESGKKFHFAKAYTALTSINHPGNINRIWRGINLLSIEEYPIDGQLPFSFIPYKKLDVKDLMNVLRDHYEESELDKSEMYQNGDPHKENYATICSESTQYSFVAKLRNNMPVEIGTLIWFTYFRPGVNIYTPLYLGAQKFAQEFAYNDYKTAIEQHLDPPETVFDTVNTHAYWSYVKLVEKVERDFKHCYPIIKIRNNFIQDKIFKETSIFESQLLSTYNDSSQSAKERLTEFSNNWLLQSKRIAEQNTK